MKIIRGILIKLLGVYIDEKNSPDHSEICIEGN